MTFRKRHAYRAAGRSDNRREENGEGLLLVTLLQSALCVMMIAGAFVLSGIMGMTEIKTAYNELASDETDAVAVFSAVKDAASSQRMRGFFDVLRLVLEQAFGDRQSAPAGGKHDYDAASLKIPDGVTLDIPLTSSPMALPLEGRTTSPFGPRDNPVTFKADWHTGVDWACPEGTPVGAAWPGKVCDAESDDIYGNNVTIDHGGFKTRYCHCQSIAVPVGTVLRQGETVAYSGNTGMSTGPHLHFELIIDGRCADPQAERPLWQPLEEI